MAIAVPKAETRSDAHFEALVLDFLAYLEFERGLSRNTLEAYRSDLLQLGAYLERQGVDAVAARHAELAGFLSELAQGGRLGAARGGEELGDLVAREHLRKLLALAGRAQVGGRVVGDDLLAAQVAVERAQARGLALDRRRRDGRALRPAGAQLREEAGQLGVPERRRVEVLAREDGAELQQVGAIGLQRVARQAALELEVGQEIEHVVLERARG
jgi:plasmid stabilization system protein ParE